MTRKIVRPLETPQDDRRCADSLSDEEDELNEEDQQLKSELDMMVERLTVRTWSTEMLSDSQV